jgi:hypothetical protein
LTQSKSIKSGIRRQTELMMHQRNGIEGTQSELVRAHGLRRARYRGKARVLLQNNLIVAACNIRRLFRRIMATLL